MSILEKNKTNTYYVTVIEKLKKRVEVDAESEEDALEQVKAAYDKCEITLDENDFTDVQFKMRKTTNENNEEE